MKKKFRLHEVTFTVLLTRKQQDGNLLSRKILSVYQHKQLWHHGKSKQTRSVSNGTDIHLRPFYVAAFRGSKTSRPASSDRRRIDTLLMVSPYGRN